MNNNRQFGAWQYVGPNQNQNTNQEENMPFKIQLNKVPNDSIASPQNQIIHLQNQQNNDNKSAQQNGLNLNQIHIKHQENIQQNPSSDQNTGSNNQNINNDTEKKPLQLGAWNNVQEGQPFEKGIMSQIEDYAGQQYEKAQEQYNLFIKNLKEVVAEIGKKMDDIKEDIKKEVDNLDKKAQEVIQEQKEKMNKWVRLKIEEVLLKILHELRPNLKESLKDPYMCNFIKNIVDDVFEETWPLIEEEILIQLRLKMSEPYNEKVNVKPQLMCFEYPWYWIKTWYLYSTDPFDRSIWQQFRTFSWWIIFIFRLIPFYGIQSYFYIFIFLCIDKSDEFQLVNFVLCFKRMQFLTIGVIGTMIGYFTFYSCSNVDLYDNKQKYDDCKSMGPGIYLNFYADVVGFLVQLILIWIAMICLPCSKQKGHLKFKYAKPDKQEIHQDCCCCKAFDRGGKLKFFMFFDLFSALACVALFLFLSITDGQKQLWQYKSAIFLVKTIYGLLSLPFMVFIVPQVTYLVTASRDTGYDQYGNCVPQIPNLVNYHKDKMMKSSIIHKVPREGDYDPLYANMNAREINIMDEDHLVNEDL